MSEFGTQVAAIITAIIGLAIVAVLVGTNSQTGTVIEDALGSQGLSAVITAAVAPVTSNSNTYAANGAGTGNP
jgi:hypothetical protein